MATATVTIMGEVSGLLTGSKVVSALITTIQAVGEVLETVLQSGDNTIAVPTGATLVLIQPPLTNVVVLKLKGAAGDTGLKLQAVSPQLLCLDSTQTTFIVNAASVTASATEFSFI